MEKYDVNFKKKYGQNFLKRTAVVERIVSVVPLLKNDLVVEVGPGGAILTRELAKQGVQVLAYEIDTDLKGELESRLEGFSNVTVLYQDFLNRNSTHIGVYATNPGSSQATIEVYFDNFRIVRK